MKLVKNIKIIQISVLLIILLSFTTIVSAKNHENSDRRNRSEPRYENDGFRGTSSHLDVTGSIEINNGITLSLEISPNEEAISRIQERNEREDTDYEIQDFTNTIRVTLLRLLEFEDLTNNGLDENDTIISEFNLNLETLNEIELIENGDQSLYTITSQLDGTFKMIVEVSTTDDIPHDWKWSLEIAYDFEQSNSKLAMIHEINTSRGNFLQERYKERIENHEQQEAFKQRRLEDNSSKVPLFMRWDEEVFVDDVQSVIETSRYQNYLALSVIQGDFIDYDPSIGIDYSSIQDLDAELTRITQTFVSTLFSSKGILIVLLASSAILVIAKFKRD